MFRKVNLCLFWLVGLCAVLVIGITGCGEDNENPLTEEDDSALVEEEKEEVNPWVGTWVLETVDEENVQSSFKAIELLINVFEAWAEEDGEEDGEEDEGIEISYVDDWTFDNNGTWYRNVSITLPNDDGIIETTLIEVEGTYILSGSNYTITPKSVTYPDGFEFPDVVEEDASTFGYEVEDTGTWLMSDCHLTLTSDIDYTIGFEKK